MKVIAALVCVLCLTACSEPQDFALEKELARSFEGRFLIVEVDMIIHRVNAANGVIKHIITPPPGSKNRFTIERFALRPGARLVIERMDSRKHWSGARGVVPIVTVVGDERFDGVEMEFQSALSFERRGSQLYLRSTYLSLLPVDSR